MVSDHGWDLIWTSARADVSASTDNLRVHRLYDLTEI